MVAIGFQATQRYLHERVVGRNTQRFGDRLQGACQPSAVISPTAPRTASFLLIRDPVPQCFCCCFSAISPFINNLPFGKPTTQFSSADASGSTSQAANIMEALELGATTLLVDEDTCATNFMIRDSRMQALVGRRCACCVAAQHAA